MHQPSKSKQLSLTILTGIHTYKDSLSCISHLTHQYTKSPLSTYKQLKTNYTKYICFTNLYITTFFPESNQRGIRLKKLTIFLPKAVAKNKANNLFSRALPKKKVNKAEKGRIQRRFNIISKENRPKFHQEPKTPLLIMSFTLIISY